MGLSIFEETFGTSRVRFGAVNKREAVTEHLVAITHAVQAVVDTFPDPNGTKYAVSMSEDTRAYTTPDTKRIVVSFKPIFDKGLRVSTACTVMLGLTLHEIGHTLYTFPHLDVFEREFGKAGAMKQRPGGRSWEQVKAWDQLAYTVLNIGDDARLEARMSARLPVAKDVFPTMLHWVALDVGMVGERLRWRGKAMSMADRVNFAGRAVRYPWTAMWSSDEATRAERSWWIAWGRDYIALADDESDGIIRLVRAALERLRNAEDVEEPEQEQDEPQGTPEPEQEAEDDEQDPDKDEPDDESGEDEGPGPKQPGREPSQPSVEDEDEDEDEDEPSPRRARTRSATTSTRTSQTPRTTTSRTRTTTRTTTTGTTMTTRTRTTRPTTVRATPTTTTTVRATPPTTTRPTRTRTSSPTTPRTTRTTTTPTPTTRATSPVRRGSTPTTRTTLSRTRTRTVRPRSVRPRTRTRTTTRKEISPTTSTPTTSRATSMRSTGLATGRPRTTPPFSRRPSTPRP